MSKAEQREHRQRKNPSAREAWTKRKREANAARPKQLTVTEALDGTVTKITGPYRSVGA